jgi:hypothetical protein
MHSTRGYSGQLERHQAGCSGWRVAVALGNVVSDATAFVVCCVRARMHGDTAPGCSDQASRSAMCWNPAARRRVAASATAWYGVQAALMKDSMSAARVRASAASTAAAAAAVGAPSAGVAAAIARVNTARCNGRVLSFGRGWVD